MQQNPPYFKGKPLIPVTMSQQQLDDFEMMTSENQVIVARICAGDITAWKDIDPEIRKPFAEWITSLPIFMNTCDGSCRIEVETGDTNYDLLCEQCLVEFDQE